MESRNETHETVYETGQETGHETGQETRQETSETIPLDTSDLIESISWISLSTQPLQWAHPHLSLMPDLLVPENPITYLWWEACFALSLPMLPLLPFDSKYPDAVTRATNETYLRDAACFCQAALILSKNNDTWENAFLQTNKLIIDKMKELLATPTSSPLLTFYKQHTKAFEREFESFDTTLILAPLDTSDALYTAQTIASEYLVNGITSNAIPESIVRRLDMPQEIFDSMEKRVIEVGLVSLHAKVSTRLIPFSLLQTRLGLPTNDGLGREMTMETFALSCAFPLYDTAEETKTRQHAQTIASLLIREAQQALPTDLFAWKQRADKIVKLSTLVLKPFFISPSFSYLEAHEEPEKQLHVMLLPSLKQVLSELVQDEDQVTIMTRLEWNATLQRMAYCIYCVQKSPVFDEFVARMQDQPWTDRWHEYKSHPWTKLALEWISAEIKPDRGLRLSCPTMLMSVHPMARLGWWIEEKLRALCNVKEVDIETDFHPMLSGCCLSVFIPRGITWPKEWTMDLKMLE